MLASEWETKAGDISFGSWLELVAEANQVSFFEWDVRPDHVRWNRDAEARLGLARHTMSRSAGWRQFVPRDDLARLDAELAAIESSRAERFRYRFRFCIPGQEERIMEGMAHCVHDDAGLRQILGLVVDVTERDRDRHFRAHGEAQLRAIVETVPDAMVVIDQIGTIRSFNVAAERMFGWREDEVVGHNVSLLMPMRFAVNHDAAIGNYLAGGERRVIGKRRALTALRADGSEFPIELNVGEAEIGELRLFTGFVRDLSERVEAAERLDRLREQFQRNARLNAMGEVAAALAHDLNQSLSAATNFLAAVEIEAGRAPGAGGLSDNAQRARTQLARVGEMIRRLRTFVSSGDRTPETFAVREVIEEALALALPDRERDRTRLELRFDPPDANAFADRVQIQQVLVNLLRNAVDAMAKLPASRHVIRIAVVAQGDRTEIRVMDNGPGFQPHVLEELQPLFTPKGADGMGLGLSICRRIVEEQGGLLILANEEGGGACARFTLPTGMDEQ